MRSANHFAGHTSTTGRLRTNTGGMVVSTPTDSRSVAIIVNIGRSGCSPTGRRMVSGTSYAAGYLTPFTGMLGSDFKVGHNVVAAIRSCAGSRRVLSLPRGSCHHTHTTTRGVVPAAANTTGTMSLMLPRLGNGLGNKTVHIPAPGISLISLITRLSGSMATRRMGDTLGTTTRNRLGNVLTCDRRPLMSNSCGKGPTSSAVSTLSAVIVRNDVMGIVS